MDLQKKFDSLKQVLNMNFVIQPRELVEIVRVDAIRKGSVHLQDLKHLDHSSGRLVLQRTSAGQVFLSSCGAQMATQNLNEVVFGQQSAAGGLAEELFQVKEDNLLNLPILDTRNYFIASDIFSTGAPGRVCVVLLSSLGGLYFLKSEASLPASTSSLRDAAIEFRVSLEPQRMGNASKMLLCSRQSCLYLVREKNHLTKVLFDASREEGPFTVYCATLQLTELDFVDGLKSDDSGNLFVWEFGSLYYCPLTDSPEPAPRRLLILEEKQRILDVLFIHDSVWVFLVNNKVVSLVQDPLSKCWKEPRSFALPGLKLAGVTASTNHALLVTLTQPNMFEDSSEISVFRVRGSELDASPVVGAAQLSSFESEGLIFSTISAFLRKSGDYSDITVALLLSNTLEVLKSIFEGSFMTDTKRDKDIENQIVFLETLQHKFGLPSVAETKQLIGRVLLNICSHTGAPREVILKLKTKLVKTHLRLMNADPAILNSLKNEQPISECPPCRQKTLRLSLDSFVSECELCNQKSTFFIVGGKLQFLEQRAVLCLQCGIYHTEDSDRCILCWSKVGPLRMLLRK